MSEKQIFVPWLLPMSDMATVEQLLGLAKVTGNDKASMEIKAAIVRTRRAMHEAMHALQQVLNEGESGDNGKP